MYDPLVGTATEMKIRIAELCDEGTVHQSIDIWKYLPQALVRQYFLVCKTGVAPYILSGLLLYAYADAVTAATPMAAIKAQISTGTLADVSLLDLFLGNVGGSLGEVSALCLLLGLVILLASRTITWHIPVSILVTVFALTGRLVTSTKS